MYLIGLIPFGLAKLFSLFLYASNRHKKAAKIALYSLITSVTSSLILMNIIGVLGLALAGSIGGWILFIFTVKEVGIDKFKDIIKTKKSLIFSISMPIFSIVVYIINEWVLSFIR